MSDQYNFIIPKRSLREEGRHNDRGRCHRSGPYELSEFVAAQKFTLRRRADGTGGRTPPGSTRSILHQTDPQMR